MKNKLEKRSSSKRTHSKKKDYITDITLGKTKPVDPQKNMYSMNRLNTMLHKLKNYYNDMNNIRKSKELQVEILDKKKISNQKQIQSKENFGDIEFPTEKISIQNYQNLKETKEDIQKKIENLIEQKNQIITNYNNEIEYGNTLNNLIEIEKKNYKDLNEHFFDIKDKLCIIKAAKKNIDINKQEYGKKNQMFTNFKKIQLIECNRLDSVLAYQEKNNSEIVEGLKKLMQENDNFKIELLEKESNLEQNFKRKRERLLEEINLGEKIKEEKSIEQNKLIKLVLGLDLIKKYFIDLDKKNIEINSNNLLKSEDYKIFISKDYLLIDEENNLMSNVTNVFSENNGSKNERSLSFFNSKSEDNNNLMDININNFSNPQNKTTNNFRNRESNINNNPPLTKATNSVNQNIYQPKIYLKDLKEKLDNLDMDFESMDNFYTKIINKTSFYHDHMIIINSKQITLEGKKEQYIKRVRQIIERNKKNIQDLVAFNPKFAALLNELNIDIRNDNFLNLVKEKLGKFDYISKVTLIKYEEFYKKCQQYFYILKTFYVFLSFNLDKLIEDNTLDEITKENLKNIFFDIKKNMELENEKKTLSIDSNSILNFDKKEYIDKLISELEIEYIKENSKLEKIEIVIEDNKRIHNLNSKNNNESNDILNSIENKVYPFIDPYSNWSLDKLEKERKSTLEKKTHMKKCIDLKLYFENKQNCNICFSLEIPFENNTFNLLNNYDKTVNTIILTKQFIECFSKNSIDKSLLDQNYSIEGKKYCILV
jgi:hypothetical protein